MSKDIYSNSRKVRREQTGQHYSNGRPTAPPKKRRKKKKKKGCLVKICILLIILSILAVAGMAIWNSSFFTNKTDKGGAGLDSAIGNLDNKVINFLVVGIDSDDGRESNQLTDTILVASFDTKGNKVNVLQIPRDTYIGEEYTATGKINALYASGREYSGIEGLAQFIYEKFSIPIDHYATITMKGFRTAVDSIGGIQVDVPKAIDLDGVQIEPGLQTLNGEQAEKFVRQRKGEGYTNGDIDRLEMQRVFMASMVEQFLGAKKTDLVGMVTKISKELTTDMTTGDIISIGTKAMGLSSENITFSMVPGESATVETEAYGNQSVYSVHKQELTDMINEKFRSGMDPITVDDLQLEEIAHTQTYLDDVGGTVDDIISNPSDE